MKNENPGRLSGLHSFSYRSILWKDADPGIAEVEDAKKRVAGLKSQ